MLCYNVMDAVPHDSSSVVETSDLNPASKKLIAVNNLPQS